MKLESNGFYLPFMVVREARMACHTAEKVLFMNNRPLFRDLVF